MVVRVCPGRVSAIPNPVNTTQIADSVRILANPKHQHALMQVTGRAFENGPLAMGQVSFSPSLVEYLAQKLAEVDAARAGCLQISTGRRRGKNHGKAIVEMQETPTKWA
jgi:hypothetical protein